MRHFDSCLMEKSGSKWGSKGDLIDQGWMTSGVRE